MGVTTQPTREARLAALALAATPGPWTPVTIGHRHQRHAATVAYDAVMAHQHDGIEFSDLSWVDQADDTAPHIALIGNGVEATENAAFIAAADPRVVAAMAAVVGAARALMDQMEFSSDRYYEMVALCDALAAWDALEEAK